MRCAISRSSGNLAFLPVSAKWWERGCAGVILTMMVRKTRRATVLRDQRAMMQTERRGHHGRFYQGRRTVSDRTVPFADCGDERLLYDERQTIVMSGFCRPVKAFGSAQWIGLER